MDFFFGVLGGHSAADSESGRAVQWVRLWPPSTARQESVVHLTVAPRPAPGEH